MVCTANESNEGVHQNEYDCCGQNDNAHDNEEVVPPEQARG